MNFSEASKELERIEQRLDRMQGEGKSSFQRNTGHSYGQNDSLPWNVTNSGDALNITNMSQSSISPTKLRLHRTGSVDIETAGDVGMNPTTGTAPLRSSVKYSPGTGGLGSYGSGVGVSTPNYRSLGTRPPIPPASNSFKTPNSRIEEELKEIKDTMRRLDASKSVTPQQQQQSMMSGPIMNSVMNTSTNSSKAVLSALRALQEKIRKLEAERSKAFEDCASLREQLQQLEMESNHMRQVDAIGAQEKAAAARLAYERLMAEKNQVEIKFAKAEEQKKSLSRDVDTQRERAHEAEVGRRTAESRLMILESQLGELEQDVQEHQRREQEMRSSMTRTQVDQEREISSLKKALERRSSELQTERAIKGELQTAKDKMDRFLEGVLAINQALVTQASTAAAKPKKKKKTATKGRIVAKKGVSRLKSGTNVSSNDIARANMSSVPFLPTPQRNSFNILAAVSEAIAKARQKDPGQVLDELYERVGYKVLTGDDSLRVQPPRLDVQIPKADMLFNDSDYGSPDHEPEYEPEQRRPPSRLTQVVEDLEGEHSLLKDRYDDLLLKNSIANQGGRSESDAFEMAGVIEAIQQKSSQIETLKNAMVPKPPKQILYSPEAQRKKIAALKVLRDFRNSQQDINRSSFSNA